MHVHPATSQKSACVVQFTNGLRKSTLAIDTESSKSERVRRVPRTGIGTAGTVEALIVMPTKCSLRLIAHPHRDGHSEILLHSFAQPVCSVVPAVLRVRTE